MLVIMDEPEFVLPPAPEWVHIMAEWTPEQQAQELGWMKYVGASCAALRPAPKKY